MKNPISDVTFTDSLLQFQQLHFSDFHILRVFFVLILSIYFVETSSLFAACGYFHRVGRHDRNPGHAVVGASSPPARTTPRQGGALRIRLRRRSRGQEATPRRARQTGLMTSHSHRLSLTIRATTKAEHDVTTPVSGT